MTAIRVMLTHWLLFFQVRQDNVQVAFVEALIVQVDEHDVDLGYIHDLTNRWGRIFNTSTNG